MRYISDSTIYIWLFLRIVDYIYSRIYIIDYLYVAQKQFCISLIYCHSSWWVIEKCFQHPLCTFNQFHDTKVHIYNHIYIYIKNTVDSLSIYIYEIYLWLSFPLTGIPKILLATSLPPNGRKSSMDGTIVMEEITGLTCSN